MALPSKDFIRIKGARVHNLKNISVDIPKNKLVVITGLSGSGKSSLAFDTIYAEAERRFVESLSSYARQFLGVAEKPDVDEISGLSPAIAIDQRSVSKNPRSTVGTITEIYDYLRILFARLGEPHCPQCGRKVQRQSVDQMVKKILELPQGSSILILGPLVRERKGEHRRELTLLAREGFLRVRLDGIVMRLEEALEEKLDPKKKHSLEVVVDRLILDKETERSRLVDSLETALRKGDGIAMVATEIEKGYTDHLFSEHFACPICERSLPPIEPRLFSFNSPYGACDECTGLGHTLEVDPNLVLPNKNLTLEEGAIFPWARASHRVGRQSWYWYTLSDLAEKHGFSLSIPVKELPKKVVELILNGDGQAGGYEGVIPNLERRWKETESEWTRSEIERYMTFEPCPKCKGKRLKPEALSVLMAGKNIADLAAESAESALGFVKKLEKDFSKGKASANIASPLLKEIAARLRFLLDVGLEYLTLDRSSTTLAGGEAQRVRLATQIGSGLSGVIYVLDEPSVGLHPRDHARLIQTLKKLRDYGNTILVVEHDRETMRQADWILDLGPGAGKHGGQVIFEGTYRRLLRAKTLTADYLAGRRKLEVRPRKNPEVGPQLIIKGAKEHNLKNISVDIPLEKFVCVSGVSGSGKSTLVNDILATALLKHFYGSKENPGRHDEILGLEFLDKVVVVDQSPIGRTPRSNPATYTGTFSFVREIFAKTREARSRGYKSGRFSFNVKGGRCEVCEGQGVKKIEMYFLPDIYVECEECKGTRYNKESLAIHYNGVNIAQVLDFSIEEALKFFKNIPQVRQRLETLNEVGLGYMKLGQSATTLSGGEAQRVKLATELAKKATGKTLYILDEPTTGLHFEDIRKLLLVLRALVDKGNTVLVIEHNLDVLKNADWILDLGPEGGDKGGRIVAEGTPEDLKHSKNSLTGTWLKKV
ncbi:excinuclease ABC subunit A [Candidatus Giovannonibacteria bacterium RIFCSPHIGHO2_01_FULL_48_47]|nr:MAG: excinuclease ABC subunit A [Candidatus Giovannonibacteria bacterium RIFCSPHIGHO2_01_FULL_48_47]OGF67736.1 MAG: excinuclease ABC subunit A [Candidatus Giovannonibacteria bacterium RIFCSPHIGHO2_02_FULL_48_15]OGF88044.1 MAG: excinuclease ABC subunit A [Candidatus Giovannonibacteria bacterium RIFCSPLOWO2_01_FULL_48_47]OGF95885.1 MAG: excinuclease ABC subunit A [Candidatus Giovannonibacteria bacterium RIFOXYD1_FULL_48_21]HBT81560.1 excinuclease ABC subunit UvrA [Candidatus Giovannonibacteria